MELKEYITSTIKSINESIIDLSEGGIKVNHVSNSLAIASLYGIDTKDMDKTKQSGVVIAFDIATTVSNARSGDGGAGIQIAVLNLSGKAKKESMNSAVSRMKFALEFTPELPKQ